MTNIHDSQIPKLEFNANGKPLIIKMKTIILTSIFLLTTFNQLVMAQEQQYFKYSKDGELVNIPSPNSSKHDFDFLEGNWKIQNRKLKTRLNNCSEWTEFEATQKISIHLNGLGNIEHFYATFDGEPFEGMALRFFDQETKLWSIYWTDVNKTGILEIPTQGSFNEDLGIFCTKYIFNNKEILVKFEWDKTEPNNPIWRQAASEDNGKTWEWNWYMHYSKVID